jgi:hypothetical protein
MPPGVLPAPPMKIADIRVPALKTIRETGTTEAAWNTGNRTTQRMGGSFTEIRSGPAGLKSKRERVDWAQKRNQS